MHMRMHPIILMTTMIDIIKQIIKIVGDIIILIMSKSPNHDSINDEDSRSKFPGKEINKVVNLNTSSNKDKNVSPNNHAHHNNRTNYIVTNPHQLDQAEHSHTHA